MKKFTLMLLTAVSMLSACKKEEKEFNSPFKMISEKKWTLTSYKTNRMGIDVEAISTIDACLRDNTWILKKDFTNEVNEEANKCEENEQSKVSGTWELKTNATELYLKDFEVFKIGTGEATYKVLTLTDNKLTIQLNYNNVIHSYYFETK